MTKAKRIKHIGEYNKKVYTQYIFRLRNDGNFALFSALNQGNRNAYIVRALYIAMLSDLISDGETLRKAIDIMDASSGDEYKYFKREHKIPFDLKETTDLIIENKISKEVADIISQRVDCYYSNLYENKMGRGKYKSTYNSPLFLPVTDPLNHIEILDKFIVEKRLHLRRYYLYNTLHQKTFFLDYQPKLDPDSAQAKKFKEIVYGYIDRISTKKNAEYLSYIKACFDLHGPKNNPIRSFTDLEAVRQKYMYCIKHLLHVVNK